MDTQKVTSDDSRTASEALPDLSGPFFYVTQERAFAPGIASGWPLVIAAPHSKHGRLVRRSGDPDALLAALKDLHRILLGGMQEDYDEMTAALGRAQDAIAKADDGRVHKTTN